MIRTDTIDLNGMQLVRHYSDTGYMIKQVSTGIIYRDAVDVVPCQHTYEEVQDMLLDRDIDAQTALAIITGEEA